MKRSAGRVPFAYKFALKEGLYFISKGREGNQAVEMKPSLNISTCPWHGDPLCSLQGTAGFLSLPATLWSPSTSCWVWHSNAWYGWAEEIFPPPHVTVCTCRDKSFPFDSKWRWLNFPLLFSSFSSLNFLFLYTIVLYIFQHHTSCVKPSIQSNFFHLVLLIVFAQWTRSI